MIRFLTDEDFDGRIVRGLRRHFPEINLLRIQDAGLRTEMERVLLSHDVRTMYTHAYERLSISLSMPGVILVDQSYPTRTAIQEIALIAHCAQPEELVDKVKRLPF